MCIYVSTLTRNMLYPNVMDPKEYTLKKSYFQCGSYGWRERKRKYGVGGGDGGDGGDSVVSVGEEKKEEESDHLNFCYSYFCRYF